MQNGKLRKSASIFHFAFSVFRYKSFPQKLWKKSVEKYVSAMLSDWFLIRSSILHTKDASRNLNF